VTRHGTSGRKTMKPRRHKTTKSKPSSAQRPARRGHASVLDLQEKLERQAAELEEARQERTAIAEVLRIISSSPGKLEPVFQAMLENAIRICEAKHGHLLLRDDNLFHVAAEVNTPRELAEFFERRGPFEPALGSHLDRLIRTRRLSHTADGTTEIVQGSAAKYGGARSVVRVPMLKDDDLIGAIMIYRTEVRPFTDKQIELVQNFAAQAVIAIENARLLNELRQSLEQQIATANVLRVISSSPGELQPVFETMLQNAIRICDAKFGNIYHWNGDALQVVATHNTPPAFAEVLWRSPLRPHPGSILGRMLATKTVAHATFGPEGDSDPGRDPSTIAAVELGGVRTGLAVPMLKENDLVGAFTVNREEVRPFSEKHASMHRTKKKAPVNAGARVLPCGRAASDPNVWSGRA
jgi:GAF domain